LGGRSHEAKEKFGGASEDAAHFVLMIASGAASGSNRDADSAVLSPTEAG
jgi:hypothetical protein